MTKKILAGFSGIALVLGLAFASPALAVSFTPAQVAPHNLASDCWMIINGKVYNLTSFIPIHPGGNAMVPFCGQDGSAIFASIHSAAATALLPTYLIGDLATTTPMLASVSVSPSATSTNVGGTRQFTASPLDQFGAAFVGASIAWSSSNTAVATINSSGLATALAAGTSTITATATAGTSTVMGTALLTVTLPPPNPVLTSIVVSPASPTVSIGGTQQFMANGFDQFGNPFSILPSSVSWSSSNAAVGTINGSGLFSALAVGTSTITATSGNISGSALATVQSQPLPPPGDDEEGMENENEHEDEHEGEIREHEHKHERDRNEHKDRHENRSQRERGSDEGHDNDSE